MFRESVFLAAREDVTYLAKLASPWLNKLAVIFGDKIETMASRHIVVKVVFWKEFYYSYCFFVHK